MDKQSFVVRSIQNTNSLSAHVSLLLNKLLKTELHREISIVLSINDEHRLNEDNRLRVINVLLDFFGWLFILFLLSCSEIKAKLNRTIIFTSVVELKVYL